MDIRDVKLKQKTPFMRANFLNQLLYSDFRLFSLTTIIQADFKNFEKLDLQNWIPPGELTEPNKFIKLVENFSRDTAKKISEQIPSKDTKRKAILNRVQTVFSGDNMKKLEQAMFELNNALTKLND